MTQNKLRLHFKWFVLTLLTGGLFWIGWVPRPVWCSLLVAFIPLLWIEEEISRGRSIKTNRKVFLYGYLSFFWWNISTTWWVANTTSPSAGILANILNALLMCIPFMLFHITKRRLGELLGYISLPAYWITFEFLHLRWDLSWPWLTLGNGMAMFPKILQWYEYTGALGGSLWIWVSNILLFILLKRFFQPAPDGQPGTDASSAGHLGNIGLHSIINTRLKNYELAILCGGTIIVPVALSLFIYYHIGVNDYDFDSKKLVEIVQPNVDPYNEKFDPARLNDQVQNLITLTKQKITDQTDYIVWPETAIPSDIDENQLQTNNLLLQIRMAMRGYPRAHIITGIDGSVRYNTEETVTARKFDDGVCCYDEFNSAIQFNLNGNFQVYHKSILVPGAEAMPYPGFFKFLEPLALNMGGMTGSLGKQEHRSVFFSEDKTGVAPVICYESIFGEYCTEYVRRGAQLFCIITNDAWWGNTDGHIQHLYYGALRAIETRRPIARSANTGISCFIDIKGNITQPTEYGKQAVITSWVSKTNALTFYVLYGDYIGRIMMGIVAWLLVYMIIKRKIHGTAKSNG